MQVANFEIEFAAIRGTYHFSDFVLDDRTHQLSRANQPILLTLKEYETLFVLVQHAGTAVDKETLIRQVWPDTFVGDGSLARNISVLRKSLGEDSIQTIPRYGSTFWCCQLIHLRLCSTNVCPAPRTISAISTRGRLFNCACVLPLKRM
jgi:hypothetical protein